MIAVMDIDGFWELVGRSAAETGTRRERLEWLENHLAALPVEDIVDYHAWFTLSRNRACSWDMYAACWISIGYGSSDGFEYFTDWLISLGREDFEKVVDCPDRLMELPAMQRLDELSRNFRHERTSPSRGGRIELSRVTLTRRSFWPEEASPQFETFSYVSTDAYERATGRDSMALYDAMRARGVVSVFPFLTPGAEPDGEGWDFDDKAECLRRLPRLARHRGITTDPDDPDTDQVRAWWPPHLSRYDGDGTRVWSFSRGADGTRRSQVRRHLCEAVRYGGI
ncbi:DUF4240 domain-containing protein [Nonomuraea gerenzanensis]|uniref:DUF4240 domain-containing protein n=1 Tax=Nonomuraea gerenzanensis TaxID=93944 RepID=A0A1M4E0P6_9ACTN|nr:DUF4240 domain-containing protein [Nonomuraea gerenzanensis]UBU14657.1 DUF4240 domain-containing protein [Nonomuraea gerenzanensis]SBO92375.1 hypothetical protein BN4615_P1889 [Nonomuraea gerenzanensis]